MTAEVLDRVDDAVAPQARWSPGPVPRLLLVVCWTVLLASICMTFFGAWQTGVTRDEPFHVERFRNFLNSGWYVIDFQSFGGQPAAGVTDQYVYGPATMWLLHGLCWALGVEGAGEVSVSAQAYAVRHLGVALIGVLGLCAVAGITRQVLGRWGWGLVAATLLAVTPMWTGQSMFNVKDVPVATGYTLVTLGLVIMARRTRGVRLAHRACGPLSLAAGLYLTIGTRPGMWTGVAASLLAFVVFNALRRREPAGGQRFPRREGWRFVELTAGLVAASAALVLVYPRVMRDPINAAVLAASSSASFHGLESHRLYVPLNVVLELPLLILGLVGIGVVVAVRRVLGTRFRPDATSAALTLVGVQLFTLPVVAMVHGAALYSGLRQLLFATPAAAIMAAIGVAWALDRARQGRRPGTIKIVAVVACAAVVAPTVDQATLFPYNYGYHNALSEFVRSSLPPTDYYRASVRELAPHIPDTGRVICTPITGVDGEAMRLAKLDGAVDCATALSSPLSQYVDEMAGSQPALGPTEFWAVTARRPPANCQPLHNVTRRFGSREQVMSWVSRCTLDYPLFPSSDVPLVGEVANWAFLHDGWYMPGSRGVRSTGGTSTLAFAVPGELTGQHLRLVLDADVATMPRARVGAQSLAVSRSTDGSLVIDLRPTVSRGTAREPLRVEIEGSDGPLEMMLRSMRLMRADLS